MVSEGQSRRFGFVRFGHENDYRRALVECDNAIIIGTQPITVRAAKPRRNRYNAYKNRTFVASPEAMLPQMVAQQTETPEPAYALDVNPYYGGVSVSGQPVLVYPVMPFGAFPSNIDSPYVYGQQPYGQQVYYQACDNVFSLVPNPVFMDQMVHNQMETKQMDKLGEEMIARNQVKRWSVDVTIQWNWHWILCLRSCTRLLKTVAGLHKWIRTKRPKCNEWVTGQRSARVCAQRKSVCDLILLSLTSLY